MLSRRMFLRTTAAAVVMAGLPPRMVASDDRIVGFSVRCIGHLLAGALGVSEIETVYLSPVLMGERFWSAVAERAPHATLTDTHRQLVLQWLDMGKIRPSPPDAGLTGCKIWMKHGVPYWPPGLYGAMLPRMMENHERPT